jgi:hypothetical protein
MDTLHLSVGTPRLPLRIECDLSSDLNIDLAATAFGILFGYDPFDGIGLQTTDGIMLDSFKTFAEAELGLNAQLEVCVTGGGV